MDYGSLLAALVDIADRLLKAAEDLAWPALAFAGLALAMKRRRSIDDSCRALGETGINLGLLAIDVLVIAPLLLAPLGAMRQSLVEQGLVLLPADALDAMPALLVAVVVVFVGDLVGYLRHRLEHCRLLWPAHAVHHSDREMTWLAIFRFHPVNRLTTFAIDGFVLALLGFPAWTLLVNALVRHYYGMLIHADLPWTYGLLGRLFVSPAMHRWHHVREGAGVGSNFATVFSVFDQLGGTFHLPGPCRVPLGIDEGMGRGFVGQLLHPFRVWLRALSGTGRAAPRAPDGPAPRTQ